MIKIICTDCAHARKTSNNVIICTTIGNVELATLYGKCRRYKQVPKQLKLFENDKQYMQKM